MNTPSHWIITAAINNRRKKREAVLDPTQQKFPPLASRAFLWASIFPDLGLIGLTIVLMMVDLWQDNPISHEGGNSLVGRLFDEWYFHHPLVNALHSLGHAPFMVLLYLALGYWGWRRHKKWGAALFWFGLGCGLHTAIDIPLHVNDGPLVLFPFNWTYRYHSMFSYWDPDHFGREIGVLELTLDLLLILYLVADWWRTRRRSRSRGVLPSE